MFDIASIIPKEAPIEIIIEILSESMIFDKIPSQLNGYDIIHEDCKVRNVTTRCECLPKGDLNQLSLIAATEILTVSPPRRILSSLTVTKHFGRFITRR